ncbi:MAG: hypothetical protein RMH77_01705 [Sulfolobales archaeon]|nr:hypothetical protein [Sulfolobales archaeon]MCX8185846.1 hypothetical protein [Sulfolobales archaeon]MDW7969103.1 hypothetical protein [Sulfolobales archaeon]
MSKKKYVVNLGLNFNKFSEDILEDLIIKASQYIENELELCSGLGKSFDADVSIQVIKDETLTFEIVVEVKSSIPIPLEYEVAVDRIVDKTFRFIEGMLVEVGVLSADG